MANYGDKGWIKLWRSEFNNPLYRSEKFTKWQAWIDLCMLADENQTVKTSLKALKNRWLWGSTWKVSNYLQTLNQTDYLTVISTPNKGTLIRINTRVHAKNDRGHKLKNQTVNQTVNKTEEVTSKEVGMASFEVSQPNNIEEITALQEELGDEYE